MRRESSTLADVCDQIQQKIHANADNQKLPHEFPDWQSCVEDRDATIYKLGAAVVNLCQMVEYLASEQQRGGVATPLHEAKGHRQDAGAPSVAYWAWSDRQLPDGTIVWTSPSGHTYTTRPGSRLLFPALCQPTGELPTAPTAHRPSSDRGVMMPTRRRTRQQDRTHRINTERALNDLHVAERNQPPP